MFCRHTTPHTGRTEEAVGLLSSISLSQGGLTSGWSQEVRVADTIVRPDNNLWLVAADDDTLEEKLLNALVHGKT